MKKIICYGDSNTFGYSPIDGSRLAENVRWTSLLQKNLGEEYEVINEGMCDRTGFADNPKGFLYSAQRHFPKMLSKTDNIYLLILWIGTNDLQFQYDINISAIEKGLKNLVESTSSKAKNIIIIPPVVLNEKILEGDFNFQFDKTSIVKSRKIGRIFRQTANANNCSYFDINKIVNPADYDGLHYDENSHKLIADSLAEFIRKNFK